MVLDGFRRAAIYAAVLVVVLLALDFRSIKDALLAETERAVERGTFGSPTFFVDGEIYFGKDRLRDVEEAIAAAK